MTRGVEADPHIILGLEVRERPARLDRVRDARLEVVHLDLQVHHHLLVARTGRPDRAHVPLLGLEVQRVTAARRLEDDPAGFVRAGRPAEEPAVEVRASALASGASMLVPVTVSRGIQVTPW
jgi:hypothetical protein